MIEIYEITDLADAKEIVLDRFRSSRLHEYGETVKMEGLIKILYEVVKNEYKTLYVVTEDESQVGLLGMEFWFFPPAPDVLIARECHFYISDRCKNKAGATKKMFGEMNAWAEDNRCTHMMFQVDYISGPGEKESDRMCKHLEKLGYKIEAKNYIKEI